MIHLRNKHKILCVMGWDDALVIGGISLAGAAASAGASAGANKVARRENYMYNEKAANAANSRAYKQYYDLYSPEARKKQLEDANLSVGLMYGGQGAGGSTPVQGQQGAGAAGMAAAPMPNFDIMSILKQQQEIEALKAQEENTKADTEVKLNDAANTPELSEYAKYRDDMVKTAYEIHGSQIMNSYNSLLDYLKSVGQYSLSESLSISNSSSEDEAQTWTVSYSDGEHNSAHWNSATGQATAEGSNWNVGAGKKGVAVGHGTNESQSTNEAEGGGWSNGYEHSRSTGGGWSFGKMVAHAHAKATGQSGNKEFDRIGERIDEYMEQIRKYQTEADAQKEYAWKQYKWKCEQWQKNRKKK